MDNFHHKSRFLVKNKHKTIYNYTDFPLSVVCSLLSSQQSNGQTVKWSNGLTNTP